MTVTVPQTHDLQREAAPWQRFQSGLWQNEINVRHGAANA